MKYPMELANTMGEARIGVPAVVVYCLFLGGIVTLASPADTASAAGAVADVRDGVLQEVLLRMGALEVGQSKLEVGFGLFLAAFAALNTLIVVFFALNFRETAILAAELEARKVLKDERAAIDAAKHKVMTEIEELGEQLKAQMRQKVSDFDPGPEAKKILGDMLVAERAKAEISKRGGRKKT